MDRRREYVANELDQVGSKLLSALTVSVFLEHGVWGVARATPWMHSHFCHVPSGYSFSSYIVLLLLVLLQKVREDSLDALLAASDAAIAMSQHTLDGFSGGDAGADEVRRLWGGGGGSGGGGGGAGDARFGERGGVSSLYGDDGDDDRGTALDGLLGDAGLLRQRGSGDDYAAAEDDEAELTLLEQQLLQLSYERAHNASAGHGGTMHDSRLVSRVDGWQRRRRRPAVSKEAWEAAAAAAAGM